MFPPKQPRTTHDSAPHARGRTETHLGVGYHAWLPWVERTPRVSRLRNSRTLRYAVCVLPHFLTSPSPPPPPTPPPRRLGRYTAKALAMHRKFLAQFSLTEDHVPIFKYDPIGSPSRPFLEHTS
jgi:hypothetical protein